MTLEYEFDDKVRFLVIYQTVTKKASSIQHYTGIKIRTIYDWIQKIEEDIDILAHQPGQGRKPQIAFNVKRNIRETARRQPQRSSSRRLGGQYGVGKDSALKALKEKNFNYGPVKKTVALTEEEQDARVNFCEAMLEENGEEIYNTIFCDEMGINLSDAYRKEVWHPPSKKVKVDKVRNDVHLNCWGGISAAGATPLHIYKGPLNKDRYIEILEEYKENMDQLYPYGYNFVHDNLKVHTSAEDWMVDEGFQILHFPTWSPDLTPIENFWRALKIEVAKENPKTEAQLRRVLLQKWKELTEPETLRPYFDTLFGRYEQCIDSNGVRLNY